MSSASKRLVGIFARIAEERVARGRSPTSSRPRKAKSYTTTVLEDPQDTGSGGEAELASMVVNPPVRKPTSVRTQSTFIDDIKVLQEASTDQVSVVLLKGIDYADLLTTVNVSAPAGEIETQTITVRQPEKTADQTPKAAELTLIDRLFGGKF